MRLTSKVRRGLEWVSRAAESDLETIASDAKPSISRQQLADYRAALEWLRQIPEPKPSDLDEYDSGFRACQVALHQWLLTEVELADLMQRDGLRKALEAVSAMVGHMGPHDSSSDEAKLEAALAHFARVHGTPNTVPPSELSTFHVDLTPMRIGRAAKLVRSIFVEGRVVPVAYRDRRFILGE